MSDEKHWQRVHDKYAEDQVSWFQARPESSLRLIEESGVSRATRIIDVGGGASRLVDNLLEAGYSQLGVLDIADRGMARARERLGKRAEAIQWVVSDVTRYEPETQWELWHDRAVFHFLVDAADRERYRQVLEGAVAPDGHVIIATFGPNGPERCSGLPAVRYGAEELSAELGSAFVLRKSMIEDHRTPSGAEQQFLYTWFQRVP
jgi:SAM-dependent methyltransferase